MTGAVGTCSHPLIGFGFLKGALGKGECAISNDQLQADKRGDAPLLPSPTFAVGVTGHRATHSSFPEDPAEVADLLDHILSLIEQRIANAGEGSSNISSRPPRLLTLLADGMDHIAASSARRRDWELVIPLPFGKELNAAINAQPLTPEDAKTILAAGQPSDPSAAARVNKLRGTAAQGSLFELADEDERLVELFMRTLGVDHDPASTALFASETGRRAAIAGRVIIEQSDLLIALWDGKSTANLGGTGHTALTALRNGTPVLWIDPERLQSWQIILAPEELAIGGSDGADSNREEQLAHIVDLAILPEEPAKKHGRSGLEALRTEKWRSHSMIRSHTFRRVEALFGEHKWNQKLASVRKQYEHPDAIAEGSAKPLLDALRLASAKKGGVAEDLATTILPRFIWLDGISAALSDQHRSGMTLNFILGAWAIIAGILYLPLVDVSQKWIFASIELFLLAAILVNTATGRRLRLHRRWLETRRAAEYLRHGPILAMLGVARPAGAWPHGTDTRWPEWYARSSIRAVGLPRQIVDKRYLRTMLEALRDHHVEPQLSYHLWKSERLARVHHSLDKLSERLFIGAVAAVALYLVVAAASYVGMIEFTLVEKAAKWFTVFAVALPTLGGAFAGIRFFGDFERFAEISETAAGKLQGTKARIDMIIAAPDSALNYGSVAEIARAIDEATFDEIQSWQSVFSGKVLAVPA